jgi:hypothetical protein
MYELSQLKRAVSSPTLAGRELNRIYHTRLKNRRFNPDGTNIFQEDWDNLIILDACRYDIFKEESDLPGELESRISRGGATEEFVRGNFRNQRQLDTVYVAGNSWYLKLRDQLNSELYAVFNETHQTPDPVTERTIDVANKYPNKRIISHYIPPHHPYVGNTAESHFPNYEDQLDELFNRILRGDLDITPEVLEQAYRENLHRVLPHVRNLIEELNGKTVVTADHGELLGERCSPLPIRDYGHHVGIYVEELVKVPWLVHNDGSRRDIVEEEPIAQPSEDTELINEQLRNLGYKL